MSIPALVRCLKCGHIWDGDEQYERERKTDCPVCGHDKRDICHVYQTGDPNPMEEMKPAKGRETSLHRRLK